MPFPLNNFDVPVPECRTLTDLEDLCKFFLSPSKFDFNVIHVNIRSLRANFDCFLTLISDCIENISAIILSEIWIYSIESSFYSLDGFDSFFCCREDNRSGGVVVYTRSNLNFTNLFTSFNTAEAILLHSKSYNITLFSIYRNLDFNIDLFTSELRSKISTLTQPNIILIGDINIDILNNEFNTMEYLTILSNFGFFSYVNDPTRLGLNSSTCIDHIFVKTSSLRVVSGIFQSDLTDHFPIVCNLHFPRAPHTNTLTLPEYSMSLNYHQFYDYLASYKFNFNFDFGLDQQYQRLIFEIGNIKNNYKFRKPLRKKCKQTWITNDILALIKRKEILFKKHRKYPFDLMFKTAYKTTVSELKRIIKYTKSQFYKNKFDSCVSNKQKWNFVNNISNDDKKISTLPETSSNSDLASEFNTLFSNSHLSFQNIERERYLRYLTPCISSFVFFEITNSDVFDSLNSFSNLNSIDYDGISLRYLKLIANNNIDFFTRFINSTFITCVFPDSLKRATVTPIFKSGCKNSLSNYRPISILPSLAKIIEKVISKRMFKFLNYTNFFADNQYGFIEGRSTEMALVEFSKFIYKSIDESKLTVAIFLDLKKAFDNVNHSILIDKLHNAGFRGDSLKWFISYLTGRLHRVKIINSFSDFSLINRGVPQGSILGPLFFLIYINDLCKLSINGKILTYADDTVLLYSSTNKNDLRNQIEADLIEIGCWLEANDLTLNLNKTKYIHFSLRQSVLNLNIKFHSLSCNRNSSNCSCYILQSVHSIKYLGLHIDSNLKWKTHISELGKRLRFVLYKFFHLKNKVSLSFLKSLYYAWFYSLINYGIIIWGGEYISSLQPLISLQNKCFKIFRPQSSPLRFKSLKLLPIRHNAYFRILLYIFRNKSNFREKVRQYNTRSTDIFEIPTFSKDIFSKNFDYLAPKLFNSLPSHLITSRKYSTFRRLLFDFLINIDDVDVYFSL